MTVIRPQMNAAQLSRRSVLAGMSAALALPAAARAPDHAARPRARPAPPTPALPADLVAQARLGGRVSYIVTDRQTGEVLEALNPNQSMPPASVEKVLTALYAMAALGGTHRFATRLIATGPVQGGALKGNLVLAGGGDPVLSTDDLAAMARDLRGAGVTSVEGDFLVWAGALPRIAQIDIGQPPHLGYNPSICGLNLNFNRVHFQWRRGEKGYATVMDAPGEKANAAVQLARMRVVDRQSPLFTYSAGDGLDNWTVASRSLGQNGSRWLPVRRPELYAGEVFRALAVGQGIRLGAPKAVAGLPAGNALVEHRSPELGPMLRDMLKYSVNLTAEVMGLSATIARGGAPESLTASAASMQAWAGQRYGISVQCADHSGLGDGTRLSAADMVRLLAPEGPLPGLLRDHSRESGANVVAKTGTLNFVSALSGYMTPPNGRALCFAIFLADTDRRDLVPAEEREAPVGAREWGGRARGLQDGLLKRWGAVFA